MHFDQTRLRDCFVITPERYEDSRGWFARTFCRDEFVAHGLIDEFGQCSASFNPRRGTLRGMHFQRPPYGETKLVRCTRGAVFDVMLDLRPTSASFGEWQGVVLSADNGVAIYAPAGFAHGFQTLQDDCEVFYQIAGRYDPVAAAGVRWDDPAFGIAWPIRPPFLSARDASLADFLVEQPA